MTARILHAPCPVSQLRPTECERIELAAADRDARTISEARDAAGKFAIRDEPFRGSGAVWDPEGEMVSKRKNKDYFANAKAQAWWALRLRFQATWRALHERMPYDPDAIISINPRLAELLPLTMELSQPTYSINSVGKILVDKTPDGMKSPNLADAVMIAFEPSSRSLETWIKLGRSA
jgi:phage terminase large subunit